MTQLQGIATERSLNINLCLVLKGENKIPNQNKRAVPFVTSQRADFGLEGTHLFNLLFSTNARAKNARV